MSSKFAFACIKLLCNDAVVKRRKPLTVTEFARMGGKALAKKMTKQERQESARRAAQSRWAKAKQKKED
ncbi:MAG: hypothetical protein ACRD3P_06335 [Terriglobales bacterium]